MVRTIAAAAAAFLLMSFAVEQADAGVTKGRINETGQTTSYGAGSDGDLRRGLPRIFNDLGNGVIKDARTGLLWEKKSDDGSIHDKDNTYTWGQTGSPYAMDGTMSTEFLAALNTPPCFAGSCDWRIPNRMELESIENLGALNPSTFAVFNSGCTAGCTVTTCSCTVSGYYWTSSSYESDPSFAWTPSFYNGGVSDDYKENYEYVRAVRGGF